MSENAEYKDGEWRIVITLPQDGSMSIVSNAVGAHLVGLIEMGKQAVMRDLLGPTRMDGKVVPMDQEKKDILKS